MDRNDVLNLASKSSDINEYLMSLYNIPLQIKAKTILEIGAGVSTVAFTAAANALGAEFYSIDMCEGAIDRAYPRAKELFDKEPRCHLIIGDDMEIFKTWDKKLDVLFLDSTHFYEQTKKELATWPKKVGAGGVFIMHDTAHETGTGMGCRQALEELMITPTLAQIAGDIYSVIHLLDIKIIGLTIMVKMGGYQNN